MTARPLNSADLFLGLSRSPVRVLETLWLPEEDTADMLWVSLSNNRYLVFRLAPETSVVHVFEAGVMVSGANTGLDASTILDLERQVWTRWKEERAEYWDAFCPEVVS